MRTTSEVLLCETVTYENFRLEYTLLRTAPAAASLRPLYGIACTSDCCGHSAGIYRNLSVTADESAARHLFDLLTENVVFPGHIDDVIHDLRETWTAPVWSAG